MDEDDEANTRGGSNFVHREPPYSCELNVESKSEGENDEATNRESCNINGEAPSETQEMSVQVHDSYGNTE